MNLDILKRDKKERFLKDLEDLLKRYDVEEREVDIYIGKDGGEDVLEVDMPIFYNRKVEWFSFILPYRPYNA